MKRLFRGGSEVIFRDAEKMSDKPPLHPKNLAPLSQVEVIRSQRSQIVRDT
ncbi:hypothetical protein [Bacteroides sp. CACC 737]|uniref:hypothetical protein n=1 Tax=Bacteroides sp. CACC 737 TaxID=2755405 RepID=UPI0015EEA66E|nr:hypothetical protein [Bacteroides sp. CACC 737]QMI81551.1 hypothetical protein H1A11_06790 [Bacteroides sp. CACC 737]